MRTTNGRRLAVRVGLTAVVAFAGLVGACSSSPAKTATPACRPAHAPQYPTTDAALSDADAGGTWCATVGQTIAVSLHVPPAQPAMWQPLRSSDTAVLQPVSNGVASLVRGVTATFFAVRGPGVVTVTSTRPGGATWKAEIVAKAK